MKSYIIAAVVCAALAAPDIVVDVPVKQRQTNWVGNQGQGSCAWASLVTLFRWQNRPATADYIRQHCGNGAGPEAVKPVFDRLGIRYAETFKKRDVKFLEWSIRTHRGCAVAIQGYSHMVCLVALNKTQAGILDNNSVSQIKWVSRKAFLADWYSSNSWAITPVYSPLAPTPTPTPHK
jgi:hypothetical protein